MGNCSSNKHKVTITDEEIDLLKESWMRAKHENIGSKILATLLEKKPQFAQLYEISEASVRDGTFVKNQFFILQAARIQNFLDTAVLSLGSVPQQSVFGMARRIGQIHYYKGVNFGTDSYTIFRKIAVDSIIAAAEKGPMPEEGSDPDQDVVPYDADNVHIRLGWNKLMSEIVREMKDGFVSEAKAHCKDEDLDA